MTTVMVWIKKCFGGFWVWQSSRQSSGYLGALVLVYLQHLFPSQSHTLFIPKLKIAIGMSSIDIDEWSEEAN